MCAAVFTNPVTKVLLDLEQSELNEDQKSAVRYLMIEQAYTAARVLDGDRYAAVAPRMFTHALIVGSISQINTGSYTEHWCYETEEEAMRALREWDGAGEPDGWHRHPYSGRRRPDKTAQSEYVNP